MSYRISLVGKVALIVGGSGGIGDASARSFSGCGAHVAVTHRVGADKADAAKQVLNGTAGDGHAAFAADVADTATLLALRDAVTSRYGRLDILVNSAGFTTPVPHTDLDALDDELIDRMFAVNWRGQLPPSAPSPRC